MSANILNYYGRKAAWHELGNVTGNYMTFEQLKSFGGLNFLPEKQQLFDRNGKLVESWGVFRPDTGDFLGAVGSDYTVIDHAQGFMMIDALLAAQNGAHYETAGVLGKGEKVWGLADLNVGINVGTSGDKINMYLLFSTSHDGSMGHSYRMTGTRVVCQNTLNIALKSKTTAQFRVRHTVNAQKRLDTAHEALALIGEETKSVEEKLNLLAQRKMTKDSMKSVLDRLFPGQKDEAKMSTRRENILADVLRCYENNDRNTFPEQRGTAYNLLNAVTEYTDHMRSTRKDDKGESAMFGSGDRLKTQAMEVLLETAGGLPVVETRTVYVPPTPRVIPTVSYGSILDQIIAGVN
jgi:phage/plasmid-like protein (TIGR03299 family)